MNLCNAMSFAVFLQRENGMKNNTGRFLWKGWISPTFPTEYLKNNKKCCGLLHDDSVPLSSYSPKENIEKIRFIRMIMLTR